MTRPELRGVDFLHRPSPSPGEWPFRWAHMRGELPVGARGAGLRVEQRRVPVRDARGGNPLVRPVAVASTGPFGILRQPVAAARSKPAEGRRERPFRCLKARAEGVSAPARRPVWEVAGSRPCRMVAIGSRFASTLLTVFTERFHYAAVRNYRPPPTSPADSRIHSGRGPFRG